MENGEQKEFRCTGDCLNCNRIQREYCGAQKGYDNQRILLETQKTLLALTEKLEILQQGIATLKEEDVAFAPQTATETPVAFNEYLDTAQEGAGVIE